MRRCSSFPRLTKRRLENVKRVVNNRARIDACYHEHEGHDLDLLLAFEKSQEFLAQILVPNNSENERTDRQ